MAMEEGYVKFKCDIPGCPDEETHDSTDYPAGWGEVTVNFTGISGADVPAVALDLSPRCLRALRRFLEGQGFAEDGKPSPGPLVDTSLLPPV